MPACARASTSLIALEFWAVRSSSSLVLLMIGVVCSLTYFLLAQPTVATMLATSANANEVRFMYGGLLPLLSFSQNLGNSTFILCLEPDPLGRVKSKSRPVLQTGGLFSQTLSEHERCQPYTTVRLPIKCSPHTA